ncbi:hypothetical protein OROHE_003734 [Orobanche hederae]
MNCNTNIPKAISGWVPKSKSTAATGSLPRDEATEIYELINIHKKVDERIQKLHETLEDGSSKILGISEAKATKIQTKKDNSSQSRLKEFQVLTTCFKEGMSIRNTSSRGTRNDTGMNESVVVYQELRDKTEIQAIQLQKLHEKLEEFLDQTMRKHEDMVGMIEAKKIPRKKEWSGNADLWKWKLNSTGAETKDVLVKIWDEKVDIIDDGIVVKEEVKFLANNFCDHPNLPKLIIAFATTDIVTLYVKMVENIVLNKEYSPVVVDFGLLFGGLKGGPRYTQQLAEMSYGYDDPYFAYAKKRGPENDVYSFGINLLALMAKRTDKDINHYDMECINNMLETWACREYTGMGVRL